MKTIAIFPKVNVNFNGIAKEKKIFDNFIFIVLI